MSDTPSQSTLPDNYASWLSELKQRIAHSQYHAVLAVNTELVALYWKIGNDILERQKQQGWGSKVIEQLAKDLKQAFPEMKGFSRANLLYMRAFADAWPDFEAPHANVQQLVGQIPWGHNLVLLSKFKDREQRLWYAEQSTQRRFPVIKVSR